MADFDLSNLALKMVCPSNELITDDKGIPGVYVQRAPLALSELLTNGDDTVHPAFLVNDTQVSQLMIGKFQGKSHTNRIYSLPGVDPTVSINIDTYVQYCRNKGTGHHCITAAEWAFLALLAKKNGTRPKGNNNYGRDTTETTYIAIPSPGVTDNGKTARILTGTGPLTWSDTGDNTGIFDLNGNIWEMVTGIRLVYGEIQVIPYNNAAALTCDLSAASTAWKAINAAATSWDDLFIEPDGSGTTTGSVKLDYVSSHWQWQDADITSKSDSVRTATFATTTYSGLSDFCKMYLQAMALGPDDDASASDYNGYFFANNGAAERIMSRGGTWNNTTNAGVFSLLFSSARSSATNERGGRPAFYK